MTKNTTASYVSGYRDCRGCREQSVNLALSLLISFLYLDLYVLGDDSWISSAAFMRTKHICVFRVRLLPWNEFKPSSNFPTDRSKTTLLFLIFFLSLPYCSVCVLYLLGTGWPLGSPVCDVFLCFCHFIIWCPGSSLVLDCIDSRFLHSSLLYICVFYILMNFLLFPPLYPWLWGYIFKNHIVLAKTIVYNKTNDPQYPPFWITAPQHQLSCDSYRFFLIDFCRVIINRVFRGTQVQSVAQISVPSLADMCEPNMQALNVLQMT